MPALFPKNGINTGRHFNISILMLKIKQPFYSVGGTSGGRFSCGNQTALPRGAGDRMPLASGAGTNSPARGSKAGKAPWQV